MELRNRKRVKKEKRNMSCACCYMQYEYLLPYSIHFNFYVTKMKNKLFEENKTRQQKSSIKIKKCRKIIGAKTSKRKKKYYCEEKKRKKKIKRTRRKESIKALTIHHIFI